MKKLTAFLIIITCLLAFAMPAIAEKEDNGIHADLTIAAARATVSPSGEQEQYRGTDDARPTFTINPRETAEVQGQSGSDNSKSSAGLNLSKVKEDNRKAQDELNATLRNISSDQRERVMNQNEVRIAVHSLLEMENLSGGIGHEVSAIARDFNNSASSARVLEDRIQARNSIVRLFLGGDREAAGELINLTTQNQARIQQLQQLINSTSLDADVRATLEDQVRVLQNDQVRLEQLAAREQQDRGIFGYRKWQVIAGQ
jgi:hypothetical protein